jgi:cytochrome b involved in lipid metabolism
MSLALIYKIIRISAWLLLLATLLFLFSGFLSAKYFLASWISYKYVNYLHVIVLPLLFTLLFYIHSLGGAFILISRHRAFNKKCVKIITVAVWTFVLGIAAFFYFAKNPAIGTVNNPQNNQISDVSGITLNLQEIAKHNLSSDCWMIINGKVYDLTGFLRPHPGGASTIIPYCGKDGTAGFDTKNGGAPHSSYADSLLNSFYLGNLGQSIGNQTIQNIKTQLQNIPVTSEEEHEED